MNKNTERSVTLLQKMTDARIAKITEILLQKDGISFVIIESPDTLPKDESDTMYALYRTASTHDYFEKELKVHFASYIENNFAVRAKDVQDLCLFYRGRRILFRAGNIHPTVINRFIDGTLERKCDHGEKCWNGNNPPRTFLMCAHEHQVCDDCIRSVQFGPYGTCICGCVTDRIYRYSILTE